MLAYCASKPVPHAPEAGTATMEDVTTSTESLDLVGATHLTGGTPSSAIMRDGTAVRRPSRLGRLFCYTRPQPVVAATEMPVGVSGRHRTGGRMSVKRFGGFPPATTWGVHPPRSNRAGGPDDTDDWPHNGWWTLPDGTSADNAASWRPYAAALTAAGIPDPSQGALH
ncbi:hypothetical protein MMPV_006140 [Pyropia vietnamensis]